MRSSIVRLAHARAPYVAYLEKLVFHLYSKTIKFPLTPSYVRFYTEMKIEQSHEHDKNNVQRVHHMRLVCSVPSDVCACGNACSL